MSKRVITIKNNYDIKEKILGLLKTSEIGASSTDIAKSIGHNRITISKYLEVLQAQGLVKPQDVAQAKLWKLVDNAANKPSVLLVDDEPHVVNLLKLSLSPGSFNIHEALSGHEALDILKKNKIDLVVLDLMMPGMNGYEVCKLIKENPLTAHIHVIILSAKGELRDKLQGIDVGADDYITKPFDPMELEARVNLSLKHSSALDKHPVTLLPAKRAIEDHLVNLVVKNIECQEGQAQDFNIYNFRFNNLNKFIEKKGYKRHNEMMVLFKRLLNNSLKQKDGFLDGFLGHTMQNNFVVVSNQPGFDTDVVKGFEKMMPYLDESSSKSLSVVVDKVTSSEIKDNNLTMADIFGRLRIS
jgi:DNA-binding response OmpR family regulator